MTKAGDEYQAVVGAVAKALDPGAVVRVGVWVVGPDGRRDLDVEVLGSIEGRPHFVHNASVSDLQSKLDVADGP